MNILIYGDTLTSPALRHEVPISIGDPFLYLESDGRRAVLTNALEDERIARDAPEIERLLEDHLGRDELIGSGLSRGEIEREVCVRAVDRLGITRGRGSSRVPDRARRPSARRRRRRWRPTRTCSSTAGGRSRRRR